MATLEHGRAAETGGRSLKHDRRVHAHASVHSRMLGHDDGRLRGALANIGDVVGGGLLQSQVSKLLLGTSGELGEMKVRQPGEANKRRCPMNHISRSAQEAIAACVCWGLA